MDLFAQQMQSDRHDSRMSCEGLLHRNVECENKKEKNHECNAQTCAPAQREPFSCVICSQRIDMANGSAALVHSHWVMIIITSCDLRFLTENTSGHEFPPCRSFFIICIRYSSCDLNFHSICLVGEKEDQKIKIKIRSAFHYSANG